MDEKQVSGFQDLELGTGLPTEKHKEICWSDGIVQYPDCGYVTMCIC